MIVRELVTRLGFSINDSKLKSYERGIGNIKTQADSAANAFRGMFAAFVGFQGLKSLANTADEMQSLEARIGMLPQTVGSAADAFDEISRKAIESRTSLESYGTLYVRLAGATKNFLTTQEDVLTVTTAISNALVVGGAKSNEAASAVLQLSQAFQKGKLDGDEFRAFMETMSVDVKERLAKELGANDVGDLFKMSSNGELTAKKLAEAFKEIAPEIKAQMMKMPMTISQSGIIILDRWQTFINKMNRESKAVTSIAKFFLKAFDVIEASISDIIDFFGGATQAVKFFGIALAAILIPVGLKLLVGLVATLLTPMGLLVAGLILVGLAIEDIYQYMNGGVSVTAAFIDWLKQGSIGVSVLVGVVTTLTAAFVAWGIASTVAFVKAGIAATVFFVNAAIGLLTVLAPFLLIIAAIVAVVAALYYVWNHWDKIMGWMGDKVTWVIDQAKKLANFFGTDYKLNAEVTGTKGSGNLISAEQIARQQSNNNLGGMQQSITVNQTLPPGTTAETASAAKNATIKALQFDNGAAARQMGQAQ